MFTWGKCNFGQLGHGHEDLDQFYPYQVAALKDITIVDASAGESSCLGLAGTTFSLSLSLSLFLSLFLSLCVCLCVYVSPSFAFRALLTSSRTQLQGSCIHGVQDTMEFRDLVMSIPTSFPKRSKLYQEGKSLSSTEATFMLPL